MGLLALGMVEKMKKPYLTLVIPVYNEEDNLLELYQRLKKVLDDISKDYEIIFIDDGSIDNSFDLLKGLHNKDNNVKVLSFSRNFGHQIAITAGLDFASGNNIIFMDADLQDPPEIIPELLNKREEGNDVVYTIRKKRYGETKFKLLTAHLYYSLINKLTGLNMPVNAGDFRLLSRRAADSLKKLQEQNRYIRGLTSWIGFHHTGIYYDRPPRYSGKTKYPLLKMLKFAIDGITSFSHIPLRFATYFGLFIAIICFVYIVYVIILKITGGYLIRGWSSTIIAILFIGSIQLICLGIIGEYMGRIYDEEKKRPIYIIMESIGFEDNKKINKQYNEGE